jgi:hypothetical protein
MVEMVAEVEAMGVELRLAGGKVTASFPADLQRRMAPLLERCGQTATNSWTCCGSGMYHRCRPE